MAKRDYGQAGVAGCLINRKWKDHTVTVNSNSPRAAELVMCITKRYKLKIIQAYAPTTSYSEQDINSFYNDVDETLGKPIVMDFNAQIWKRTNPVETATGKYLLKLRNAKGDTLVEWATPRNYKIKNTIFRKKAGKMWKSTNGVTKTEIDYILTKGPDFVTDVTVINQVDIGSGHRMVIKNKSWLLRWKGKH